MPDGVGAEKAGADGAVVGALNEGTGGGGFSRAVVACAGTNGAAVGAKPPERTSCGLKLGTGGTLDVGTKEGAAASRLAMARAGAGTGVAIRGGVGIGVEIWEMLKLPSLRGGGLAGATTVGRADVVARGGRGAAGDTRVAKRGVAGIWPTALEA